MNLPAAKWIFDVATTLGIKNDAMLEKDLAY